jgi:protoporphyrinogen oxidase
MPRKSTVSILGGGMAGFGAAYRLQQEDANPVLYEKNAYPGGHTASFRDELGFIFDEGPHISFTKDERIQGLFAESVNQEYEIIQARVNNFWKGQYWIKHPAQCNLYGLPTDLVVNIVQDFIYAKNHSFGEIRNYEEWLRATYGNTFAENFPMEYGRKYHTTSASNMSTSWLGPRLYQPNLEEVLRGALTSETLDVHYVNHFRYPSKHGFVSYLNQFLSRTVIQLNHELRSINPKTRGLHFANGSIVNYDNIISSLPLPELVRMILGVPKDVQEAAKQLACTSCVLIDIGLNRCDVSEAHWTYFYDQDISFARVSFPHMLSPHNVPPGKGSIQAEVYFSSKYRPLEKNPQDYIQPVIADLRRCGLLAEDEEIIFARARLIPFANIIFDLERADALATVQGYLDEIEVFCCGRYGEWGYHWTDEAFISGENAAQKILDSW